ncbi:MAG: hypothetical protein NVV70_03815 [Cellulomonas sp.]|nr:hypothetical protein [Cellulomonas sp.]MCR6647295.1 hypothetical protein [Cellulomonas sp.]
MSPTNKVFDGTWPTPASMRAPRSVFHFTDMAGLYGIVKEAELWATEASGLNDPTEVSGGMARIFKWMNRHSAEPTVRKVLDVVPSAPEAFGRIYVLSACLDGDDAGQWRAYGDGGRGCAIELDTSMPLTVKARQPLGKRGGWPRLLSDSSYVTKWTRTIYTDDQLDAVLRGLTSWAERQFDDAQRWASQGDESAPEASVEYVVDALLAIAALLKPPGYHGEAEARVVVTLMNRSPHTSFRPARYGLVQYATLAESLTDAGASIHHGARWTLPIKSIRLGPHASFDLSKNTVRDFLDRYGYVVGTGVPGHVRVLKSGTPMR